MSDANENMPSSATGDGEAVETVVGLMRDMRTVMVTTSTADGSLTSRPMTVQEVTDTGDVWIIASSSGAMVDEMRAHPEVNLAFTSSNDFVSLSGRAEVGQDVDKARELWNRPTDAWFEDGPEDPDMATVLVHGDSAQYWDGPGQLASLTAMLTASFTDNPPDTGESEEVDL